MTHTAKCSESVGEDVCLILSAALCFSAACSHDLRHEITHLFGCAFLHLPCDVGVGAECEARIIVAEHTADGFDVHAILQCQRCEGMSEIMKADMLQSRVLEDFLMKVYHRVWVVHFSCSAGREHPRIVRVLGVLLLQ